MLSFYINHDDINNRNTNATNNSNSNIHVNNDDNNHNGNNNDNNNNESVKISVRFLSNQIRSDALSIKVFYKQCGIQENCRIEDRSEILSTDLAEKILTKAAVYEKQNTSKKKKPYIGEIK